MHPVSAEPLPAVPLAAEPGGPLRGRVTVPGDKSISHRALMLGALAIGETRVAGLLESADVMATAAAMRAFGAKIARDADGTWRVARARHRRAPGAGGRHRFRQCRNRRAARHGNRRRASLRHHLHRRRLAVAAADGAGARSPARDGRGGDRTLRRPAAAPDPGRRPDGADHLPRAGALGAGEVGGAPRRAQHRGDHHGDRAGGDARPHRADARRLRRGDRGRARGRRRRSSGSGAGRSCEART